MEKNIDINLTNFDIIIKSPGIPFNDKILLKAESLKKLIISDIELFSYFYPNSFIIAVTGTNGKTSTTLMIQKLLSSKMKTLIAGNIGIPIFDLESPNNFKDEIIILECSSYMLANTYYFHPKIALITNIYPNHLNNHGTFSHYYKSKLKILQNMKEDDTLIYYEPLENYEEIQHFNGKKYKTLDNDNLIYLKKDDLYYQDKLLKKDFSRLYPGLHNLLNIKMAIICAILFKISFFKIKEALKDFTLPNFRLEKIYDANQLVIYNDSKSTNQLALINAIETLKKDDHIIHLILGGMDRNDDWSIIKNVLKKINIIYIYGENRLKIKKVIDTLNIKYYLGETLEEVLKNLPKSFDKQNTILFSPGCPSLDQYLNYIERGNNFNKLIFEYYKIGKI